MRIDHGLGHAGISNSPIGLEDAIVLSDGVVCSSLSQVFSYNVDPADGLPAIMKRLPGDAILARRLPDFVVIGAQKAGSTFVHRCLQDHPQVVMPLQETRFFEDPEYLASGLSDLADLFKTAPESSRWGIKRPDYLARAECLPRIHQHLPNARLFVSVRNPLDRAISAFYYYMRLGFIPLMSADDGLIRLLDGELSAHHPRSGDILDYGLYFKHIARYLAYFSRDQLKIIVYDDIKAHPSDVIRECYEFINVDPAFSPPSRGSRPNRGIYSPFRLWWMTKRIPFIYDYNADRTKILPKRQSMLDRIIDLGVVGIDRLVFAHLVPNRRPRLAAGVRRRLADFYRDDVAALSSLLGRRLDWLG